MQWFLKMEHLAEIALKPVMDDELKFYPPKYKNTYRHWMENIKDWNISRQLWWGHRIPAWFLPEGGYVVAMNEQEALEKARAKTGRPNLTLNDIRQDEDCLDTWFSSWLWPISLFNGILDPGNEEMKYYYPTSDLVTGPDIIFFWVARMIMAGYEYEHDMPFRNVYFTGIVRDKQGCKMSKSKGNSPDPLELIDRYGADGVRMGMMLSAPAGNDILFDVALCEQGRNFNNKIWNAFRLIKGWKVDDNAELTVASKIAMRWFESVQNKTALEMADLFGKYRLSEALMAVYKLFWDEFSSWYLEIIKPAYGQGINRIVYTTTLCFLDNLLKLLHPFMPFITEEIWQQMYPREEGESIMVQRLNMDTYVDEEVVNKFELAKDVIGNVRTIRLQKNIAQKEPLELQVVGWSPVAEYYATVITKMCNLSAIRVVEAKADDAASFMIGTIEYAVPLGHMMDIEAEIARMEAELKHKEEFLQGVRKKLDNENFVGHAPAAVLEMERKKQTDAESIINSLKESIAALRKGVTG
jgi:valyl-tRNA synthetase